MGFWEDSGHKHEIDHRIFSLCMGEWGGLLTVGGPNTAYHKGGARVVGAFLVHDMLQEAIELPTDSTDYVYLCVDYSLLDHSNHSFLFAD